MKEEDNVQVMERVQAIIQRLREKNRENGRDTNQQSQQCAQLQEVRRESSEERVLNLCPICEGKGYIVKRNDRAQDTVIFCKCRETDKAVMMWKLSGIETEKNRLTFGNYKPYNNITEKARGAAIAYFKSFNEIRTARRNSIAFLGQVGSGKTHLSVAIGLNLLSKGIPVIYMCYRNEILKLKQNILDEEYYAACIRKFKTTAVLIIDDLFKGKISDSDINIIFEIINYRYMNNLPIIVSSEYIAERLLYFDEGVSSRIIEMCKDFTVEIEGKENNYRVGNR